MISEYNIDDIFEYQNKYVIISEILNTDHIDPRATHRKYVIKHLDGTYFATWYYHPNPGIDYEETTAVSEQELNYPDPLVLAALKHIHKL